MARLARRALVGLVAIVAIAAGLLAAGYIIAAGDHVVEPTVAQASSLPSVSVNGTVLHAQTFGEQSAPTVIMVHGGPGGDHRSLLPLQALSDEFFVVFYDQRGSGLSARVPSAQLNVETLVADLDAMADRFAGIEQVHIVGHSWGGALAAIYAARYPDRVAGLVLAEPVPLTRELEEMSAVTYGPVFDLRVVALGLWYWLESLHVEAVDRHARPDYLFTKMAPRANPEHHCANGNGRRDPDSLMWRSGSLAIKSVRASLLDETGRFRDDLIDGLEAHQDEVLFLVGECSELLGQEFQARQMELLPNSRMVVIEESGHLMFSDQPDRSVEAVRTYLRSND